MELTGAVSVVTGGTGGLGRDLCSALAAAGSDVAIVCRSSIDEAREHAASLEATAGVRARAFRADVTDPAAVDRLRDDVLAGLGRVDVLVNDAAMNRHIAFDDLETLDLEVWDQILRTNATGPFLCSRALAPALAEGDGGRIVNISSIAGFAPIGSSIAYAVSKAALNHLTRCLAVALAPSVLVNGIAPGFLVGTRMNAGKDPEHIARVVAGSALRRPVANGDVADQVLAFARTESTTGQIVCIDAGRYYH